MQGRQNPKVCKQGRNGTNIGGIIKLLPQQY